MMATLEQIERALRAADAAGNTEDARRLAQAYAETRDSLAAPPGAFDDVQSGVSSTNHTGSAPASPAPKQRTAGERFMREVVGLGTRNVVEGAADVAGIFYDPIADAVNWLGEKAPTTKTLITGQPDRYFPRQRRAREISDLLLDTAGAPKPETAEERVAGDVGRGLSGTALTMGTGTLLQTLRGAGAAASSPSAGNALARAGDFLTAQPMQQAIAAAGGSAASGVAREAGVGPGGQALAGLGGAMTPAGLAALGAAGLRGLVRGRSGAGMQQTIDDFRSIGAQPSVGQASGNALIQGAENILSKFPTSAGVVNRFAERQADDIGAGLQSAAERLSPRASGERAGRAVKEGVETFSKNVGAQRRALYWLADKFIPPQANTPMANTVKVLGELTTPNPGAAETTGRMVNPRLRQMLEDLTTDLQTGGGSIPYDSLRRIRTAVGEQMSDFSMTPDTPARQLSALYSALSRDMEDVARGIGPRAEQAARRANNYTKLSANRLEQLQHIVDKNGGPEAVFNATMQGTRDGGTTLRKVMQSLPKEGQEALTAAVIKRMGLATPGAQDASGEVFSAATFMTNWNRVSPEAKRALFDRHGPEFSKNMDQIARVASNIKEGAKVYQNPAGTADRATAIGYAGSLAGALLLGRVETAAGLAVGGVGANMIGRLLTKPWFVSWLAQATRVPVGAGLGMIQALGKVGAQRDDEDAVQLAQQLESEQTPSNQND